jgi:hypothetical protein
MKSLTLNEIISETLHSSNGVYIIHLCDLNGNPVPIYRLCGKDSEGHIYIGAAEKTTLSYRLITFLHSMNPERRQSNHSAGSKIKENENLRNWLNEYRLYFDVEISSNPKELERNKLNEYKMKYGEVPPLNG